MDAPAWMVVGADWTVGGGDWTVLLGLTPFPGWTSLSGWTAVSGLTISSLQEAPMTSGGRGVVRPLLRRSPVFLVFRLPVMEAKEW